MPTSLTRRHILISAAATAAVAAMPAAAIAAVEQAPERWPGFAFVVSEATRSLLAMMPLDIMNHDGSDLILDLIDETVRVSNLPGPHRWIAVNKIDSKLQVVGDQTWSYRQARIDAGYQLRPLS